MPYTIRFTPRARRDFSSLDRVLQERLEQHIDRLAENPFPAGAKRLHAEEPYYRIRVGDYRIIYQVDGQQLLVIVIRIGHRKDVYRHLRA
ncbi:MAG: type II toxin-antitoxin system RelE/ParE family toxin [Acidobacteriia bacterium]|nr:type II toxin-antitoxin system RelE/ParE family toxin [Terriglobia bacterium]